MDVSSFFDYPDKEEGTSTEELVFLHQLSDADWGKLLAQTETRRYEEGDALICAGEIDRALYLLTEGTLEVLIPQKNSGLRRLTTIEVGSVIGEQSFLDGKPRSAVVRAMTPVEVIRLSVEAFEILAAREPELARQILFDLGRILSLRLRHTSAFISNWVG